MIDEFKFYADFNETLDAIASAYFVSGKVVTFGGNFTCKIQSVIYLGWFYKTSSFGEMMF